MKKVFTGIVAVLLVAALAIPAFAATLSDSQKDQINNLYDQMANLRKQLVQKYVDAGELTKDEATQINKNIDNATKYQKENSGQPGYGAGYGCGGAGMMGGSGYGMMGGYGGNGMMGGYGGNGNARNVAPTI